MPHSIAAFGDRVAPPGILEGLRAIDADADLVHLGGNEWMLGVRRPNPAAQERIDRQLKTILTTKLEVADAVDRFRVQSEMGKEFQLLQFFATGFRPIHIYTVEGDPGHDIVADFQLRDFNWRVRPEAAFRELADEVSVDVQDAKRTALVREAMNQEAGSMFRFFMRKAKSFLVGSPKGATT